MILRHVEDIRLRTTLSKSLEMTDVKDIGRRSFGVTGLRDFGIGTTNARFHSVGKTPVCNDRLNRKASCQYFTPIIHYLLFDPLPSLLIAFVKE